MTGAAGGDGGGTGAAGAGAPGAGTGAAPAAAPAAPSASPVADHGYHEPDPFIEMLSGEDVIDGRKLTPLKAFQQRNRERLKAAFTNVAGRIYRAFHRSVPSQQMAEEKATSDLAVRNLWKDQNAWAEQNRQEKAMQDGLADWTRHAGYKTEWPHHASYKERMRNELHAHSEPTWQKEMSARHRAGVMNAVDSRWQGHLAHAFGKHQEFNADSTAPQARQAGYAEKMRNELHAHEPSRKSRNEHKSGMQHKNDNGMEMI